MYGELWMGFLDKFGPTGSLESTVDVFDLVYRDPMRVVGSARRFFDLVRALLIEGGYRYSDVLLEQVSGREWRIKSVERPEVNVRFHVSETSTGPFAMTRRPWHSSAAAPDGIGVSYVGNPQLKCEDEGRLWTIGVRPLTDRAEKALAPTESVRYWLRWRHPRAVDEDVIASSGWLQDGIRLSYAFSVDAKFGCDCFNSFVRIAPEYTFASYAAQTLEVRPVAYSSEIFAEWRWYSDALQGWIRRRAHRTSKQLYAGTTSVKSNEVLRVAATFENHVAERRRVARAAIWAVLLSILVPPVFSEVTTSGQARTVSPLLYQLAYTFSLLVVCVYGTLDYLGVARNPLVLASAAKVFREGTLGRWLFRPAHSDRVSRQRGRIWSAFRMCTFWLGAVVTAIGIGLDYLGKLNVGDVIVVEIYIATAVWVWTGVTNYCMNRLPEEM